MPRLRALRAAASFLTRIPVGGFPYSQEEWHWAPAYFPVVGAAIGGVMGGVYLAMSALGPGAAALLSLSVGWLITGALHEDGLADTADALGASAHTPEPNRPEQVRAILKDSNVGTYAILALIACVLLRVELLVRLQASAVLALVVSQSLSRIPPLWMMASLPYVTDPEQAKSQVLIERMGWSQAAFGTCFGIALCVCLALLGVLGVPFVIWCAVVLPSLSASCQRRFERAIRGITGDFLGATQILSECALLIGLTLFPPMV